MIVTLKAVHVNDKKVSGEPLITKNGDPYWNVVLDTDKGKMSKLFTNEDMIPKWQKGEQVNIEMTTKGNFVNWDFPKVPKGQTPYSIQPDNTPLPPYEGVINPSQKHNPIETTYQNAKQVFKDPDFERQERIIRGMCFNNACTIIAQREDPEFDSSKAKEALRLAQELYKEMYDWLNLKS